MRGPKGYSLVHLHPRSSGLSSWPLLAFTFNSLKKIFVLDEGVP